MKTDRGIRNMIKPDMISPDTLMVLVNAIHFKGNWTAGFKPRLTKHAKFFVSSSSTVKVPMMRQKNKFYWANLKSLASTMLELPYKGNRMVMQVLLPNDKDGLGGLEKKLKSQNLQEMFEKQKSKTTVNVKLPKFKAERTLLLRQHLVTMGMKNMFDDSLADFSGIDGTEQLFVSEVFHKTLIDVNEKGGEAAGAEINSILRNSVRSEIARTEKIIPFVANHPFIFYVRDKTTGMLLFQGRVSNPLQ